MNDKSLIINLFNKLMVVDQFDEKYCKDIIQLAQAAEKFFAKYHPPLLPPNPLFSVLM